MFKLVAPERSQGSEHGNAKQTRRSHQMITSLRQKIRNPVSSFLGLKSHAVNQGAFSIMSQAVLPGLTDISPELALKLRLVEITPVPQSQLPFRVIKKRTGVVLGSFRTQDDVVAFLNEYALSHLQSSPTRKRFRR
jgi:hypothetical protein